MSSWQKTGCVLCAQNCGLLVHVEGNKILEVRPDKDNPRSQGYICRKGTNIARFQSHAQRLTHPLKKDGASFKQISWEQAIDEIAAKLKGIVTDHGPRSVAYMGGGGQGCHFEAAFGRALLSAIGSQYHYNALAQELTGMFWVHGRAFGKQYLQMLPDEHHTDMLVSIGWNGWMSHQMAQARRQLKRIADDPDKLLVVIDPRRTETAEHADMFFQIRPGTDALFTRAVIAIILAENLHNKDYIAKHVSGFDEIRPLSENFDAKAAIKVCELDYDKVREFARLFATRKSSLHADLGTLMSRHSTLTSYLQVVMLAICGRICVPGGNIIPGTFMPIGSHSDERKPSTWRTVETNFPAIMGYFPPNVMPEEIVSDKPDRLRAVIVSGSNPLRSYADTTEYEKAFAKLDLLVTIEVAMSETAAVSHYVLPAPTAYEKWDATFFAWTYPEVFFQMRRPVAKPLGEPLEESEIFTRIADRMGYIPVLPESLVAAAQGDRAKFGMELMGFIAKKPDAMKIVPFIIAKTLGPVVGSNNLAALWGLIQTAPPVFRENAARAGFKLGPLMGDEVFKAIIENPSGVVIGKADAENNFSSVKTKDGKIDVAIPELYDELKSITADNEEIELRGDGEYPFVLAAGRHMDMNANTLMRDPGWNEGRRACTLAMHPKDADSLGLEDGQTVRVSTAAGSVEIDLEVTSSARPGHVVIPHGFGLVYEGVPYGANVNRLSKSAHRDPIAATPLHRYIPCKVEAIKR